MYYLVFCHQNFNFDVNVICALIKCLCGLVLTTVRGNVVICEVYVYKFCWDHRFLKC